MDYKNLFLAVLLFASCNKIEEIGSVDYSGDNCIDNNESFQPVDIPETDEHYHLDIFNNSEIDLSEYNNEATIVAGDKIVFKYRYSKDDDPMIMDDEYSEVITFEVDTTITDFIISGENLSRANAVYGNLCYCFNGGYFLISNGCIKGTKLNDLEWQIDINIETKNGLFSKMLSEVFTVSE